MTVRGRASRHLVAAVAGGLVVGLTWWSWQSGGGNDASVPAAPIAPGGVRAAEPSTAEPDVDVLSAPTVGGGGRTASASGSDVAQEGASRANSGYSARTSAAALAELVAAPLIATPAGRSHAMAELAEAERQVIQRMTEAQREGHAHATGNPEGAADATAQARSATPSGAGEASSVPPQQRLYAAQLQAITILRSLVTFMEENEAAYDIIQGQPAFRTSGQSVQFSHFLAQASRSIGRVASTEREQREPLRRTPARVASDAGGAR